MYVGSTYVPYFLEYRPGRFFPSREFDPALKRGRHLNVAGVYNKINVRYFATSLSFCLHHSQILLGSMENSLAAASFDFFSAVSSYETEYNGLALRHG